MSGSADRRHADVKDYRSEGWPPSLSSSSSAAAVCYEFGCVTPTMPTNAGDQFRLCASQGDDDTPTTSTSFWFGRPTFPTHEFRSSPSDLRFYDQRSAPMVHLPSVTLTHALPSPVPAAQPAGPCCNFSQLAHHSYDRFPSSNCEYLDLQPFQHSSSYPWLSQAGESIVGTHFQQGSLTQCVGCPPPLSSGPYAAGPDLPYSPPPWVHVKCERRGSLSAAPSSGADCSATSFAVKRVQTSPTSYCDERQLKREAFTALRPAERGYGGELGRSTSADVDKEDWTTTGRCLSDTSPSSVEQCSDAMQMEVTASSEAQRIPKDEAVRRRRRREQNRRAARKCREKKKESVDNMLSDYARTLKENERLRMEKDNLQSLVARLQEVMRVHKVVCDLTPTTTTAPPPRCHPPSI